MADGIDVNTLKPSGSSGGLFDGFNIKDLAGTAVDIWKFNKANQSGQLAAYTAQQQTAGTNTNGGNKSINDVLAPVAQAYAADQTNKYLNKNQPVWLYTLIGLGIVFTGVILWRPKRQGGIMAGGSYHASYSDASSSGVNTGAITYNAPIYPQYPFGGVANKGNALTNNMTSMSLPAPVILIGVLLVGGIIWGLVR